MLAIAGGVTWLGYLLFVYGFSQVRSQNYSILDLAVPGKFVPGVPPDSPGPTTKNNLPTPCTKAQLAAGMIDTPVGCTTKGTSTTGGCVSTSTGKPVKSGKHGCPPGSVPGGRGR